MLLARVRPDEQLSMIPLRGVFASEDAWLLTGDLFRRDADGDYWRVEQPGRADPRPPSGPVFTGPIRDALGRSAGVDLVVAYGVSARGGKHELAVAAVTLRTGPGACTRRTSRGAFDGLVRRQRPRSCASSSGFR